MRIKNLTVKNFRSFGSLSFDLDKKINVFFGIDGSGKSSILDCLAVLQSCLFSAIQSINSSGRSFSEKDITNTEFLTENSVTIEFEGLEYQWKVTKTRKGYSKKALSELHNVRELAKEFQRRLQSDAFTSLPLAVYYPVNRSVIDIPLQISSKTKLDQLAAYEGALTGLPNRFQKFFEWYREREDVENEHFREQNENSVKTFTGDCQLEAVRQAIEHFLPGFSKLHIQRQPLRMVITKDGEELIINQLSDGEKCTLAMIGDIARRLAMTNPGLSDPLQGCGIVMIDEVDLYFDPTWQRRIVGYLENTFPNCQFILTTRSSQVISDIPSNCVWRVNTKEIIFERGSDFEFSN